MLAVIQLCIITQVGQNASGITHSSVTQSKTSIHEYSHLWKAVYDYKELQGATCSHKTNSYVHSSVCAKYCIHCQHTQELDQTLWLHSSGPTYSQVPLKKHE